MPGMEENVVERMQAAARERKGPLPKQMEARKEPEQVEVLRDEQIEIGLDEPLLTQINWPRPTGWRILVDPLRPAQITSGGIVVPEEVKRAETYLQYIGRVVTMGPLCYKNAKFEGGDPWCKLGDHIAFGQYAGQTIVVRDDEKLEEADDLRIRIKETVDLHDKLQCQASLMEKGAKDITDRMRVLKDQANELRLVLVVVQGEAEHRLRLINDDEVLAVLDDPGIVRVYV